MLPAHHHKIKQEVESGDHTIDSSNKSVQQQNIEYASAAADNGRQHSQHVGSAETVGSGDKYVVYAGEPCYKIVNNKRVYRKIAPTPVGTPTAVTCSEKPIAVTTAAAGADYYNIAERTHNYSPPPPPTSLFATHAPSAHHLLPYEAAAAMLMHQHDGVPTSSSAYLPSSSPSTYCSSASPRSPLLGAGIELAASGATNEVQSVSKRHSTILAALSKPPTAPSQGAVAQVAGCHVAASPQQAVPVSPPPLSPIPVIQRAPRSTHLHGPVMRSQPARHSAADLDELHVPLTKRQRFLAAGGGEGVSGQRPADSSTSNGGSSKPATSTAATQTAAGDISMSCCRACGIHFEDYMLYVLHRSLHDSQQPWRCSHCGKDCLDKYSFNSHLMEQLKHRATGHDSTYDAGSNIDASNH